MAIHRRKLRWDSRKLAALHAMKQILLALVFFASSIDSEIDLVEVDKPDKKMYLMNEDAVVKEYQISLGANPRGNKQKEGDGRTPEGEYILDYKKEDSSFYRAIHISHPNENDKARAKELGVSPGGFIMVHGQRN